MSNLVYVRRTLIVTSPNKLSLFFSFFSLYLLSLSLSIFLQNVTIKWIIAKNIPLPNASPSTLSPCAQKFVYESLRRRRRCCRRREGHKEIDFGRVPWFYLVPLIRSIRSDNGCRKKEKTWLKSGTQGKPITGVGYHIVTNRISSRIATRNSILN